MPDKINTVVVVEIKGDPIVTAPPAAGELAKVSSRKSEDAKNILDGDRITRWVAGEGEREATIEVTLDKPTTISCFIVDEPWHPWDNKTQSLKFQYKSGKNWKQIVQARTADIGHVENFRPVKAKQFRMIIENKDTEPILLELQLYGPE